MPFLEPSWHKIADRTEDLPFATNQIAVVEAAGKPLCVGKYQNAYYAFAYTCPHAGGVMAKGFIDALGNVACPLHRYKFSLKNGYNVTGEGYRLKTYPVAIRTDGIYVCLNR